MTNEDGKINTSYDALVNYTNNSDKYELRIQRPIWGMKVVATPKEQPGLFGLISTLYQKIMYVDKAETLNMLTDVEKSIWTSGNEQKNSQISQLGKLLIKEKNTIKGNIGSAKDLIRATVHKLEIEKMVDRVGPIDPGDKKYLIDILEKDPELVRMVSSLLELVDKAKGVKQISRNGKLNILDLEKNIALHLTKTYPETQMAEEDDKNLNLESQQNNERTRDLFSRLSSSLTASAIETRFAWFETANEINAIIGRDNALDQKGFELFLKVIESNKNPSEVLSLLKNITWLSATMRNKTIEALEENRFPDLVDETILLEELVNKLSSKEEGLSKIIQHLKQASSSPKYIQAHTDSIMPIFLVTEDKKNRAMTSSKNNMNIETTWEMDEGVKLLKQPFIADRVVIFKSNGNSFEARCRLDLSSLKNLTENQLKIIFKAYATSFKYNKFDAGVFRQNMILLSTDEKFTLHEDLVAIIRDFDKRMTLECTCAQLRIGNKEAERRYHSGKKELIPLTQTLLGSHFKIDSQTENRLLRFLSEDPQFFKQYNKFLDDVKQSRWETLDQLKKGTFSKNKLTRRQQDVNRAPTELISHLGMAFNLKRDDPKIVRLLEVFSTLRDTSILPNTQMNTDCLIPIELLSENNMTKDSKRQRTVEALKKDNNFPRLGTGLISAYPHWENTTSLQSLKDDPNKKIVFKGDRVITFKTKDDGITEARIPLDLSPLGELDLKSLDTVFQWMEMDSEDFTKAMNLVSSSGELKIDTEKMTEIYQNFVKESERRIASALINLSLEPIEKRVSSFETTLKGSMDLLNQLPELSNNEENLNNKEILNINTELAKALKTNPDCINNFNELIKTATALSSAIATLPKENNNDFERTLRETVKQRLLNFRTGIKDGTIFQNLQAVKISLETFEIDKTQSLTFSEKANKWVLMREAPPIKNLVISGGGAKGVVLPGVIRCLEETKVADTGEVSYREQLENIAGSSVGALTAGFIALGVSAKDINASMEVEDFKALLGKGIGPVFKSGEPLLHFMRNTMKNSVTEHLKKIYGVTSLAEITNIREKFADRLPKDRSEADAIVSEMTKLLEELGKTDTKITFAMLNSLHKLDPKNFKDLTVTATCNETGETVFFNADNTPDLEIALGCRASAALPLVLQSVPISKSMAGLSKIKELKENLTFSDGGYLNNVPVEVMNKKQTEEIKGERGQNLGTLVLVFDETGRLKNQPSPFHNVQIVKPIYNSSKIFERVLRDWLPYLFAGIKTKHRNTVKKAEKLDLIRTDYTQRNIPLLVDGLKTTSFDKAQKDAKKYEQAGYDQMKEYIDIHHGELIYHTFDNLKDLASAKARD